jgi:hypothetical protein
LIENSLNKYSVFNANAFYSLSEDAQKSNTFGAYRNSVITQKVSEMDVDAESRNKSQFFKNDPLSDDNTELTPSGDTDDQSSEMWGAFENYYENGIKTSTSNESISFSDYGYIFKKKDYGVVYKTLTSSANRMGIRGSNRTNQITEVRDVPKLVNRGMDRYKQDDKGLVNSENRTTDLPISSDYVIIGDKIFRDKISFELADSFSEDYNVNAFSSAISKYYRFLTGESLIKYKPTVETRSTAQQNSQDIDLSTGVISNNFEKHTETVIDAMLFSGIVNNKVPNALKNDSMLLKPNFNSSTGDVSITDVLIKLKARRAMGKTKILTGLIEKISKKFDVDLSKYKYIKSIGRPNTPVHNKPKDWIYSVDNDSAKQEEWVLLSKAGIGRQFPSSISEKLSDYINTFSVSNNNPSLNLDSQKVREDIINNHILNTITEDNFGIDNKMRLTYIGGVNSEYEVKLPRVLSTLQDVIDDESAKKFITNYKKKKTNEFAENYSWDSIDPDDTVEDAEEGDLESHSSPT